MKYIEWFVLSSVVSGWIEHWMSIHRIHNLWLFHFNSMLELGLLLTVFYYWRINDFHGKIIRFLFIFYALSWIIGIFTFEPLTKTDEYTSIISKCIQIGLSVWLMLIVSKDSSMLWKEDPRLWISSGLILYNVTTLIYFGLFGVLLVRSRDVLMILNYSNWFAIIISYTFFLRAFFCNHAPTGTIH
jgi:hypothetical protein